MTDRVPAPPRECRTILGMAIGGELGDLDSNRTFGKYEQAAYDQLLADGCIDDAGGITDIGRRMYAILGGGQ